MERASNYTELDLHTLQVKQCIDIALQCVHPDKEKRPNTLNIIGILNLEEGSSVQNGKDLLVGHQVYMISYILLRAPFLNLLHKIIECLSLRICYFEGIVMTCALILIS